MAALLDVRTLGDTFGQSLEATFSQSLNVQKNGGNLFLNGLNQLQGVAEINVEALSGLGESFSGAMEAVSEGVLASPVSNASFFDTTGINTEDIKNKKVPDSKDMLPVVLAPRSDMPVECGSYHLTVAKDNTDGEKTLTTTQLFFGKRRIWQKMRTAHHAFLEKFDNDMVILYVVEENENVLHDGRQDRESRWILMPNGSMKPIQIFVEELQKRVAEIDGSDMEKTTNDIAKLKERVEDLEIASEYGGFDTSLGQLEERLTRLEATLEAEESD